MTKYKVPAPSSAWNHLEHLEINHSYYEAEDQRPSKPSARTQAPL